MADRDDNRIQKYAADGTSLFSWGGFGTATGAFDMPSGIAVGPDGTVYVTDWQNNRVQAFDLHGVLKYVVGQAGTSNGQFTGPQGVTIDAQGILFVADTGTNRIQAFGYNGIVMPTHTPTLTPTMTLAPTITSIDTVRHVYPRPDLHSRYGYRDTRPDDDHDAGCKQYANGDAGPSNRNCDSDADRDCSAPAARTAPDIDTRPDSDVSSRRNVHSVAHRDRAGGQPVLAAPARAGSDATAWRGRAQRDAPGGDGAVQPTQRVDGRSGAQQRHSRCCRWAERPDQGRQPGVAGWHDQRSAYRPSRKRLPVRHGATERGGRLRLLEHVCGRRRRRVLTPYLSRVSAATDGIVSEAAR